MSISAINIYIGTSDLVQLSGLKYYGEESYINDATVVLSLYEETVVRINASGPAVNKGGGKVGIPVTAHTFIVGGFVRIIGTYNYDGEYLVDATSSANELVITATYAAEVFTGTEELYKGVDDAKAKTMSYVAASDGVYEVVLDESIRLLPDIWYYAFITATKSGNVRLIRKKWKSAYAG
jgi:hypothetical protein